MKTFRTCVLVLAVLLIIGSSAVAALQVPSAPEPSEAPAEPVSEPAEPPEPPDPPEPAAPAQIQNDRQPRGLPPARRRQDVRIGQDLTLQAGETTVEAVVIFGHARIAGHVERDMVVVMGTAELLETASVGGSLVVIGSNAGIAPGARVDRDVVVVGGTLDAPADFRAGGEHVVVGVPMMGAALSVFTPWVNRGLLLGRPLVPDLPWMWVLVGVLFLVYALLTLLFERPVRLAAGALDEKPLTAFGAGLLVMILLGPITMLLMVSVVGLVIVPFLLAAVVAIAVVGRVATARWLGMRLVEEGESDSRLPALRSLAIGFAVLSVAYMVPVLGMMVWMLVGIFGLGGATLALIAAYRRENPPPPLPPFPPVAPPPPQPPAAHYPLAGQPPHAPAPPPAAGYVAADAPSAQAGHGGESAAPAPPPPPAGLLPPAGRTDLLAYPHATFAERLAAGLLDLVLVAIVAQLLRGAQNIFLLLLLGYLIGFWAWKGTSVGGIIVQLRVTRADGAPLQFVDALVRGLSSLFSMAVLGLGFLWILRDPERQAWHDKIAGTYVVKVPRNYPL